MKDVRPISSHIPLEKSHEVSSNCKGDWGILTSNEHQGESRREQLAVFATYTMITFPQNKLVKKKLQQTLETVKE